MEHLSQFEQSFWYRARYLYQKVANNNVFVRDYRALLSLLILQDIQYNGECLGLTQFLQYDGKPINQWYTEHKDAHILQSNPQQWTFYIDNVHIQYWNSIKDQALTEQDNSKLSINDEKLCDLIASSLITFNGDCGSLLQYLHRGTGSSLNQPIRLFDVLRFAHVDINNTYIREHFISMLVLDIVRHQTSAVFIFNKEE